MLEQTLSTIADAGIAAEGVGLLANAGNATSAGSATSAFEGSSQTAQAGNTTPVFDEAHPTVANARTIVADALANSTADAALKPNPNDTKLEGNVNQYNSGYWVLLLPLINARYIFEGIDDGFKPREVLKRVEAYLKNPLEDPRPKHTKEAIDRAIIAANKGPKKLEGIDLKEGLWVIPIAVGLTAATAFYTSITYKDMNRLFAEPLGWEFDKDPKKDFTGFMGAVREASCMLKSQNTLVRDAVNHFKSRTLLRLAMHVPFLAFLFPTLFKHTIGKEKFSPVSLNLEGDNLLKNAKIFKKLVTPKGAVSLGVGTESAYLATDALFRKKSFFEELQSFVDHKINHKDGIGSMINATDLMNLYARQTHYDKYVTPLPAMNTPQWQDDVKVFTRLADLMNQTYGNALNAEGADMTVSKFLAVVGMGYLKSPVLEENLACVEVANTYGVKAVQQISKQVRAGGDLKAILSEWPAAKNMVDKELALPKDTPVLALQKSFASKDLKKPPLAVPPLSQAEKLAQAPAGAGMMAGV